jgi:hypothetical protein
MFTIYDALDAFFLEHRRCGELDGGVEDGRVWMMCDGCGACIVRLVHRQSGRYALDGHERPEGVQWMRSSTP